MSNLELMVFGTNSFRIPPYSVWLGGKTPAEAAGIDLKLDGNKWMALIQKVSKKD